MKKLITNESPRQLIDAYMHNSIFRAVVTKHEIAESEYSVMLEDAVAILAKEVAIKNEIAIKYARRFGPLNMEVMTTLTEALGAKEALCQK